MGGRAARRGRGARAPRSRRCRRPPMHTTSATAPASPTPSSSSASVSPCSATHVSLGNRPPHVPGLPRYPSRPRASLRVCPYSVQSTRARHCHLASIPGCPPARRLGIHCLRLHHHASHRLSLLFAPLSLLLHPTLQAPPQAPPHVPLPAFLRPPFVQPRLFGRPRLACTFFVLPQPPIHYCLRLYDPSHQLLFHPRSLSPISVAALAIGTTPAITH